MDRPDSDATRAPAAATPESPGPSAAPGCWSRIGVEGDASCRELEVFVHCRNCPVYSAAGAQLLNRPAPPDYQRQWTEHIARRNKRSATTKLSAIVFRVAAEWLALPAHAFQEIAEQRPIHSLPHRRQGVVLGLVNVRGELLVAVSLSRLLGLEAAVRPPRPRAAAQRLLVVAWDGKRLVFPADEVQGIRRLQPEEFQEPPATSAKAAFTLTRGAFRIQDHTVGLLDPELLFSTLNQSLS